MVRVLVRCDTQRTDAAANFPHLREPKFEAACATKYALCYNSRQAWALRFQWAVPVKNILARPQPGKASDRCVARGVPFFSVRLAHKNNDTPGPKKVTLALLPFTMTVRCSAVLHAVSPSPFLSAGCCQYVSRRQPVTV
jgi:hypothetical protein